MNSSRRGRILQLNYRWKADEPLVKRLREGGTLRVSLELPQWLESYTYPAYFQLRRILLGRRLWRAVELGNSVRPDSSGSYSVFVLRTGMLELNSKRLRTCALATQMSPVQ